MTPKKPKLGRPRREPRGIVRKLTVSLTPTVYDHYSRLGKGQPSKAARETLELAAKDIGGQR